MTQANPDAIVVGASAGAVQALSRILPLLPADFPFPILVVVHVPDTPSGLADLFASKCRVAVSEPDDKEPLAPATVYFAPPGYHMLVEQDGYISLSSDAPVLFSRPSIDVLFESAAEAFGHGLVGVVLTGANEDGAQGAAAICANGGTLLVEDPDHAFAATMPAAALAQCPTAQVLPLDAIADFLLGLTTT